MQSIGQSSHSMLSVTHTIRLDSVIIFTLCFMFKQTLVFRSRNSDGGESEKIDKQLYENAIKARDEERTQRQELSKKFWEMEARLAEIDKLKADEAKIGEEKKLKEKQKFEELEAKWWEDKKSYETRIAELEPIAKQFGEFQTKQVEELKSKIPEAKKEFVEKLIAGKSTIEQIGILPDIIKEMSAQDFGGSPDKTGKGDKAPTNIAEAASLNDALGMIFAKKQS